VSRYEAASASLGSRVILRPIHQQAVYAPKRPSVFVCYAHGDEAVVLPHIDWLESQHVALWFDRGIQGGAMWRNEIGQALERSTHVIFFVSRASLASEHCDREVQYAIDHGKKLIPVFVEAAALPAGSSVALGRVQALYTTKADATTLRGQLLSALGVSAGSTTTAPLPPKAHRADRRYVAAISIAAAIVAVASVLLLWTAHPAPESELPPILDRSLAVLLQHLDSIEISH
jgi:hypothetical protein